MLDEDVMNITGGMEHAGGVRLNDHKRKLKNRFEICRKLGQGTYGKVQLGINKETGQQVAIKTIKKSKIETEADLIRIRREIQIMSSVQHPNIIHIYEVFENKEKMVLVMEIAAGGELYDYLSERKCLEENEARRIFRQISCAIYYCHKNNICHRDLKLENILLDENGNAKIADFGLSNVYDGKNLLNTYCGSPLYASPEIVRGNPYAGPEVDCWSLGVLLYTLVYGAMPFDGSNFKRLVKQITTGDYYEPSSPSPASGLVRTMLTVSAEKRANIGDICSHWWVNEGFSQTCLEEAEYLASLTPVRLDVLLSLAPSSREEASQDQDSRQVPPTPTLPKEEVMSIVELPPVAQPSVPESNGEEKKVAEKEKGKRKLSETPSMVDPDLVTKKSTKKSTTPKPTTPVPMEIQENAVYERQASPHGRSTPKVRKKRDGTKTPVAAEAQPLVPEMTPEIQRKPPKPKIKEDEQPEQVKQIKRRLSRKERNVKTPDPTFEDDHVKHIPAERPMTPRQARAPSPEDRPVVVPLPPPRVQDIPLPPVRGESLERPSMPPRSSATPAQVEKPKDPPPPPPPPRTSAPDTKKDAQTLRLEEEEARFQKQLEATISPDKVQVVTLSQPEHEVVPFDVSLPALAQAKEGVRNSGLFTSAIHVSAPVKSIQHEVKEEMSQAAKIEDSPMTSVPINTAALSLSRQEQAEDIENDISQGSKPALIKPSMLRNSDQKPKENTATTSKQIDLNAAQEGQEQKNRIGPVPGQESEHQENKERQSKPSESTAVAPAENEADKKSSAIHPLDHGVMVPKKEDSDEMISASGKEDASRSLINSLPKPFKVNNIPSAEEQYDTVPEPEVRQEVLEKPQREVEVKEVIVAQQEPVLVQGEEKSPSPAVSTPQSESPQTIPTHLLHRPEKRDNRDSKVIKAAAYWNNYIGEVLDKKKTPENVKSLEKPKKIVSAGVGLKGYNDLKSAFELKHGSQNGNKTPVVEEVNNNSNNNGNSNNMSTSNMPGAGLIQRRNSRKIPIEGCNPGLSVLDAKSAFEQKNQQQTPVVYRRNSAAVSGDKVAKGKESDEFLPSSGPNYIKKKVPEFPPPPISKTPFGVNRRPGALSPFTVKSEKVQNGLAPDENKRKSDDSTGAQKENDPTTAAPQNLTQNVLKKEEKVLMVNGEVSKTSEPDMKSYIPSAEPPSKPKKMEEPKEDVGKQQGPVLMIKSISTEGSQASSMDKPKSPKSPVVKPKESPSAPKESLSKPKESLSKSKESPTKPVPPTSPVPEPKIVQKKSSEETPKADAKVPQKESKVIIKVKEEPSEPKLEHQADSNKVKREITTKKEEAKVPIKKEIEIKIKKEPAADKGMAKTTTQNEVKDISDKVQKVEKREASAVHVSKEPVTEEPKELKLKEPAAVIEVKVEPKISPPKEIKVEATKSEPTTTLVEPNSDQNAHYKVIPIQIEPNTSSEQTSRLAATSPTSSDQSHHIPIHVEGKGPILNRLSSNEDSNENRDNFSTNSLSRRRFGSRKKRTSFAYSDSSMTGDEESTYGVNNLSGLQKYTSIGKHGEPMFRLRKTKPPFAAQRSDSFSSGEEDDFDDDGFRETTAENLFSTLLTRVKSLTRRIHDEDYEPFRTQQSHRIVNHRLNPGNSHAMLERSALRSSIKRNSSNTPSALSRQSSMDAYGVLDDGTSSMRSYASSGLAEGGSGGLNRSSIHRGTTQPHQSLSETDSMYSIGSLRTDLQKGNKHEQQQQQQSPSSSAMIMKRFDPNVAEHNAELDLSSNVSVTSKQRLRPGYLPPPSHLASDSNHDPANPAAEFCRIENALSESSSMRNLQQQPVRKIPISMEKGMSSASLASGPSQSDINLSAAEDQMPSKRHSRVLFPPQQEPKEVAPKQPIWSKPESENKSPYKFVQMKRLSVGLDLPDQDDKSTASTSSGYYSSSKQQQQQQQQPQPPQQPLRRNKEGSRASNHAIQHQSMRQQPSSSTGLRKGTAMDHYRKISSEMQMAEADIISRLRREAAERAHDLEELSNGYTSPLDPEFFNDDSHSERQRKRSNLGRLDEDDFFSKYRSDDSSRRHHSARKSISRELHDFSPSLYNQLDFSRSSRERSLGRDLEPILDVERRLSNRRSESLSRPSLASQGRSLTQSELGSNSTSSATRRLSSGLRSPLTLPDDDTMSRSSKHSSYGLDERNRADWRRISVPERGKDFKSLSKKYNRYSSIFENSTSDYPSSEVSSYLATTSSSSRITPNYLRSNSQNRVMSPTFNNSYSSLQRRPEKLWRQSSLGHDNLPSSNSASSIRLANYVTLSRRNRTSEFSPSSSPMVLSPSASISTASRQFQLPSSREGSVTPRFSHSCSNASLVSEPTAD